MVDWKYNVYLADLHEEFDKDEDDDIDVKKVVTTIYNRLLLLKKEIEDDGDPDGMIDGSSGLESSINEFEYFDFAESQSDQIEHFNEIMDNLYDFADWNFIWLNTFDTSLDGIGKP